MLNQHGMLDANAVDSPCLSGFLIDRIPCDGLTPDSKPNLVKTFQSIVGGLNWVSLSTRPDATPVTRLLASHLKNPSQGHLDSAKHVLKCLKGTSEWGIRCTQPPPSNSCDPAACAHGYVSWPTDDTPRVESYDRTDVYTDSNWGPQDASHPKPGELRRDEEVKSLLGHIVTHCGGPIDWGTTREQRTSHSVCESEVQGMDEGLRSVLAIRHLFRDLGVPHLSSAIPILCSDNKGGVEWAHSEAITKNMRHVDIRSVAIRDAIKAGEIELIHIPGKINPADIFTKEMKDKAHFFLLRSALMSRPLLLAVPIQQTATDPGGSLAPNTSEPHPS